MPPVGLPQVVHFSTCSRHVMHTWCSQSSVQPTGSSVWHCPQNMICWRQITKWEILSWAKSSVSLKCYHTLISQTEVSLTKNKHCTHENRMLKQHHQHHAKELLCLHMLHTSQYAQRIWRIHGGRKLPYSFVKALCDIFPRKHDAESLAIASCGITGFPLTNESLCGSAQADSDSDASPLPDGSASMMHSPNGKKQVLWSKVRLSHWHEYEHELDATIGEMHTMSSMHTMTMNWIQRLAKCTLWAQCTLWAHWQSTLLSNDG